MDRNAPAGCRTAVALNRIHGLDGEVGRHCLISPVPIAIYTDW
jgi:hypothetical protein